MRVIGYDQDKDSPMEVIKIPKVFPDIDKLNIILNTFDAHKELIFSKYFVRYLGFNTTDDPDYNLYFMELVANHSLTDMYSHTPYKLTCASLLFKYWALEIFKALYDLLVKCTYSFAKPIKLNHIFPVDSGTRILLGNINFLERRCKSAESQENLEAILLKNYGQLLLEMLCFSDVAQMKKETGYDQIELVTFIETLLNAKHDLKRFFGILNS